MVQHAREKGCGKVVWSMRGEGTRDSSGRDMRYERGAHGRVGIMGAVGIDDGVAIYAGLGGGRYEA